MYYAFIVPILAFVCCLSAHSFGDPPAKQSEAPSGAESNTDDELRAADRAETLIQRSERKNYYYSVAFSPNGEKVAASFTRIPDSFWQQMRGVRPTGIHIYSLSDPHAEPETISGGDFDRFRVFSIDSVPRDDPLQNGVAVVSELPRGGYYPNRARRPDPQITVTGSAVGNNEAKYAVQTPADVKFHTARSLAWKNKRFVTTGRSETDPQSEKSVSELRLWDLETGKQVWQKVNGAGTYRAAAFSPDGSLIAAGGSHGPESVLPVPSSEKRLMFPIVYHGQLSVWKTDTGEEVIKSDFNGYEIMSLAFSPDVKTIVTGGNDGTIQWWDLATGRAGQTMRMERPPHERNRDFAGTRIFDLAFSPDGQYLAASTGSMNRGGKWGELRIIDARNAEIKATLLKEHPHVVTCVAFSPDGTKLAVGTAAGAFKVWDVATVLAAEE